MMTNAPHASPALATPLPADVGGAAIRGFFAIAERWQLTAEQQRVLLGMPARSTFYRWKRDRDATLTHDILERISYLLGIYKALHILFPEAAQADAWLHKPNQAPLFNGQSALQRMLGGQVSDLYVVRQYLDANRGW